MILIGADFVPVKSNIELFCSGDGEKLFGKELLELLNSADYRIFNLETPLCDEGSPISKCGANFKAPSKTVNGYRAAKADLLTLANNHILDQGKQGLDSTRKVLNDNGISYVGVGDTPGDAAVPFLFSVKEKRIGVYACAEHEFSIVSENRAGANPFDPLESLDHIAELKKQCDYLIVLYHGGKEYYRYPSPALQKVCRKLVEKGADLVVCQHSHCIGCEEKYLDGTIVYGQGNFLFDNSDNEMWQTGLLIGVDYDFNVKYFPIQKNGNSVRLAQGEKKAEILASFDSRSREIAKKGFVESSFKELSVKSVDAYLMALNGKRSVVFRALNKLSGYRLNGLVLRKYGSTERIKILNTVECESIREVLIEGIKRNNMNGE